MTKRFAGVALAAVVGACALGGEVEAATFSGDLYGDTRDDGGFYFTFSGDTTTSKGSFTFGENEEDFQTNLGFNYYNGFSNNADFTFYRSNTTSDPYPGAFDVEFSFSDPQAVVNYTLSNGETGTYLGYGFAFRITYEFDGTRLIPAYSYDLNGGNFNVNGGDVYAIPSPVLLPAAAPMFGAALVLLGGYTALVRRRARPRAAAFR